ncbi:MAG: acyl--CoA ligase, partial [Oligoflexia bacterium]|nr:acyl--CoA ligase [Oligoflexia bacterium]
SLGLGRGDKAIICHGNSVDFFTDLLALWELGVCAISLDPETTQMELSNIANHAQAKIVVHRGHTNLISSELLISAKSLRYIVDTLDAVNTVNTLWPHGPPNFHWDDDALLLYTSGSTGQPKGVVHTFRSLYTKFFTLRHYVDITECKNTLNLLPTHFGHGLICNCLFPLLSGAHLIILPKFDLTILSSLDKIIDCYQVNFFSSVPTVWKMLTQFTSAPKGHSLKRIHCGSAPLSRPLYQLIGEWSGTKNVKNVYGITETASWIAGSEDDLQDFSDGYIGEVWGGEILVTSEDNIKLPPSTPGYIWIKTPTLMREYYHDQAATAKAIHNNWFFTGDIGYLNPQGKLFLTGRVRHEINKAGIKISPEEIDMLVERCPGVVEACTFAYNDPLAGQNVGLAVVLKQEKIFSLEQVQKWVKERMTSYKYPAKWFTLKSIHKTSRGKINREIVARQCLGKED